MVRTRRQLKEASTANGDQPDGPQSKRKKESSEFTSRIEEMDKEDKIKLLLELSSSILRTDSQAVFSMFDTLAQSLADQLVSAGNSINIDKDFILRLPLLDFQSLYRGIGRTAKSLTVSNVTKEEAIQLIPLFGNIESLILEGLDIDEDNLIGYPTGVKYLKLSQCQFEGRVIPGNFNKMLCSLQSLHFDRFNCDNFDNKIRDQFFSSELKIRNIICEEMDEGLVAGLLQKCGNSLESLTFKNMSTCYVFNDLPKLKRLTVEDSNSSTYVSYIKAPALEHLSFKGVDFCWIPLDTNKRHPLKSLECVTFMPIGISNILKLRKLQYVQIHCEWYDADELRNHFATLKGLKSFEITSSSAPTTGYNILHSVDVYSLRKIISYLSDYELETLSKVHPKFASLLPILTIDHYFLEAYPVRSCSFYREIVSQVRRLHLSNEGSMSFNEIMPHCANLNELTFTGHNSDYYEVNLDLIPLIEELTLTVWYFEKNSDARSQQWISLFRRLNPKLKRFTIRCAKQSNTITACLSELTNLEEIAFFGGTFGVIDFTFLQQYRNVSVLSIEAEAFPKGMPHFQNFSLISKFAAFAENVRSLDLDCFYSKDDLGPIINRFKNLEHLVLFHPLLAALSIDRLSLNKLTSISVFNIYQTVPSIGILELIRHFPNLKKIELNFYEFRYSDWARKLLVALNSVEGSHYTLKITGGNKNHMLLTR